MTHLTPDECIDAVEGRLESGRQAHLASCAHCRQQVTELSSVLQDAKHTGVPEPSPLFWSHFSQRVRAAIDQEPAPDSAWPAWLRWQLLLPAGAAAMLILALMIAVPKQALDEGELSLESPASPVSPVSPVIDAGWDTVATLVGEFDIDAASAAGVIEPGIAERALLQLTAEEQQELTRLLKAELTRAKS